MNRSIITANYGSFSNENGKVSEKITLDDLMYYSLYWDKIIIPCNNGMYNRLPQEEDFINSGAIVRPKIHHGMVKASDLNRLASLELISVYQQFKENDKNSDITIHHNVKNTFDDFNEENLIKQQALRVELAKILPYPSNINIYDLLEFKEKRKDELESLHQHLTNLYLEIINTTYDQDLKKLQAFYDFENSIKNLNASMSESFTGKLFFRNLISELKSDISDLGAAATVDVALLTFPSGTIVGGISIATKRVITTILKEQKNDTHLNFIKSSIEDGIVSPKSNKKQSN